uniref:tetratricopeptide repeat protein n=1 Tax=Brachyspira catarrhinii TaxID=2528966 RepID=UPI003F4B0C39
MIKKSLAILIALLLVFTISCKKPAEGNIEDDYINEIEKEYQNSSSNDVVVETNNGISNNNTSNNMSSALDNDYKPVNNKPNQNINRTDNNTSSSSSAAPAKKRPLKATIYNFYSPWTSQDDPLMIREIRVMIANKEYTQALNYINKLDFNNLPEDVDVGHLYQFKGIVHYFLAKEGKSNNTVDKNHITSADECFKKVAGLTSIEKFKPLSLLWNGMLYQTYSSDKNELQEAIALFDRVITEYPRTRFANDAVFYKAVTMKKLGMPENEYNDLFLSIKRGGFVDTLVFSQVINDYVPANDLVDREMLK